jgi:putative flippase GtrA
MIGFYTKLKDFVWNTLHRISPLLHQILFRYRLYIKYIISGGTGAVVNLGSLSFFVEVLKLHYLLGSILSFCLGFCVSFFSQKFFTFGDTGTNMIHRQLIIYLGITLGNLLLNTSLVYIFVDAFGIWYILSQIFASIIIALESFFLYRRFVFTRKMAD